MKKGIFFFVFIFTGYLGIAQSSFDSVTISRFLIRDELLGARWSDTLKAGRFENYLADESAILISNKAPGGWKLSRIAKLTSDIRANGTADVAKCFIPRHSMNFYKNGKIERFLLICFECDGLRFSDDPPGSFVKSEKTRSKQMAELKLVFAGIL